MSGILEQILDELKGLREDLAGIGAEAGKTAGTGAAAGGAKAAKPGKVTQADLTALVQPLVQDEAVKVKVKEILGEFGLKRLGDAKEEQYEALFAKFTDLANAEPEAENEDLI